MKSAIQVLFRLTPLILLVLLWDIATLAGLVDTAFLPSPRAVLRALTDLLGDGQLISNLAVTFMTSMIGLTLAIIIGIPFGIAMALSRRFDQFAAPLIRMTYSLPKSALIPLFILWFGIGVRPNALAVLIASLLPIIVYTHRGISSTPQVLIWSALALGMPRSRVAMRIMLPASLHLIFTGVRIALGFSFLLAISSEMIAARAGIGKLMFLYGENGVYAYTFAALAAVILLAYLADAGFVALSRYWLRWDESVPTGPL